MKFSLNDFGIQPNALQDAMPALRTLIKQINSLPKDTPVTITCQKGRYDFYPENAFPKVFFISNHDQQLMPRKVAFLLQERGNMTLDGQDSDFYFHGIMTPIAAINTHHLILKNLSIDYAFPQIHQLKVIQANVENGTLLTEITPYEKPVITDNKLTFTEEANPEVEILQTMSFMPDGRLKPGVADRPFEPSAIRELPDGKLELTGFPTDYAPGELIALRPWTRPTAAIVLSHADESQLKDSTVHYAYGMGLLAQNCHNVTLEGFQVARRDENDPRRFTTQADATHFVSCSGKISSTEGLYEGMADDAINVHGVYLSMLQRLDDHTCRASFMHEQCFGLDWADPQDTVTFIRPDNMQYVSGQWTVKTIVPLDLHTFEITFAQPLPPELPDGINYGIENMSRTPEVYFAKNTVRNNRARGALFSTPKDVVCEENFFDHSHGSAILLCGDCNGWFESGACNNVIIRQNHFRNCLTAEYQFTAGIISVYPEIPQLDKQTQPFHGLVTIEDNLFETFPTPLLYAKSVAHIDFKGNRIWPNSDYPSLFPDRNLICLNKVGDFDYDNNQPIIAACHIQRE